MNASPFPGMDPFLEQPAFWSDFHSRFMNAWCERIDDGLPDHYEANLGEHVYLVEHEPEARKLSHPDISVTQLGSQGVAGTSAGGTATLEPVTIPLTLLDGPKEAYIEVLHRPDHTLVAVLELLSPANKEQPGRTEYLAKRRALLVQQIHLIELDLLLGGRRLPLQHPLPAGDCFYFLSHAERRPDCDVYAWNLRQALPTLPLPLRAPDPDIFIDLAAVFATAYERGRYHRKIDYDDVALLALQENDKAWAGALIEKRSRPT
jgi:hypothetical protein